MSAEAWGVRYGDGTLSETAVDRELAEWEASHHPDTWTAVPFIAADRLIDGSLATDHLRKTVIFAARVPCRECHAVKQERCIGSDGFAAPHPSRIVDSVLLGLHEQATR